MVRVYDRINIYIRSEVLYEKRTTDIIFIIIGCISFALGVNLFVIPNEFGEGGVTGITIITYYLFEWSPGLVNLILNAILLIVGYKFLNKITTIYTIIAVVTNSLFLHLTEGWMITSDENAGKRHFRWNIYRVRDWSHHSCWWNDSRNYDLSEDDT